MNLKQNIVTLTQSGSISLYLTIGLIAVGLGLIYLIFILKPQVGPLPSDPDAQNLIPARPEGASYQTE